MKIRVQEKFEAIKLRKLGLSYKEIMKQVPVSKSSLSGWLKYINLSEEQLEELKKRSKILQDKGRLKVALINREKRIKREEETFNKAKEEFYLYISELFFIIGIVLYWAEGSKKHQNFQFVNSDHKIIEIMFKWILKYLKIPKESIEIRLYIHEIYKHENCELFWENILKISSSNFKKTVYKPTLHLIKKNPDYKGCLRLGVGKIDNFRKMVAWQKLLYNYIIKLI